MLAAGGKASEGRKEDGRDRHREDPLRQLVDAERLVDRGRRLVADQGAEEAVDDQVEIDQAEADRHRQHQQQHPPHVAVAPIEAPLELERRVAQVPGGDRKLDQGADEDADRVGVDPVLALEHRREDDDQQNDRQVPEQRRDREGAEAVVAVEHADDNPADPEQDQDREEDLGERDREVENRPFEARRDDRHDHRRGEDEEGRDRTEDEGDEQEQGRGEPEGLAVVLLLQLLGEDRHEGRLQRRVGKEGANQVGNLEGDREGRHRAADPVVGGGDDLPPEPGDPRRGGRDREERGRAGDPAGRRLRRRFLAGIEGLGGAQRGFRLDVAPVRRLGGLQYLSHSL